MARDDESDNQLYGEPPPPYKLSKYFPKVDLNDLSRIGHIYENVVDESSTRRFQKRSDSETTSNLIDLVVDEEAENSEINRHPQFSSQSNQINNCNYNNQLQRQKSSNYSKLSHKNHQQSKHATHPNQASIRSHESDQNVNNISTNSIKYCSTNDTVTSTPSPTSINNSNIKTNNNNNNSLRKQYQKQTKHRLNNHLINNEHFL